MKISTLLLGGAFLMSASVMAQNPNLMENANKGATGDKGAMAQNGWECWKFPFTYDEINEEITVSDPEQMTWDASGPAETMCAGRTRARLSNMKATHITVM